jgi:hypothetical protein
VHLCEADAAAAADPGYRYTQNRAKEKASSEKSHRKKLQTIKGNNKGENAHGKYVHGIRKKRHIYLKNGNTKNVLTMGKTAKT